jgi:hypothetical protein
LIDFGTARRLPSGDDVSGNGYRAARLAGSAAAASAITDHAVPAADIH